MMFGLGFVGLVVIVVIAVAIWAASRDDTEL